MVSINLLKATSLDEIAQLFGEHDVKTYSDEELGLFLYYSAVQKNRTESYEGTLVEEKNLEINNFLLLVRDECIERLNEASEDPILVYINLGLLAERSLVNFTEKNKKKLGDFLKEYAIINKQNFVNWVHAVHQIALVDFDRQFLKNCYECIIDGRELLIDDLGYEEKLLVLTHILEAGDYRNQVVIENLMDQVDRNLKNLKQAELIRFIQILDWMNLDNKEFFTRNVVNIFKHTKELKNFDLGEIVT